ncbi:hypothetical protein BDF14DRAFT_1762524 [Spinellus fusiger]|nr:hypothetical protein BDF14DRAFT_1762524 [Spinellus fusiger]
MSQKKDLVIVGGGAAGILMATILACEKDKSRLNITLVDSKSFFEYTPSLCSVLYKTTDKDFETHFKNITENYTSILDPLGITFIHGKIVDLEENKVVLNNGYLYFDYAILCTGSHNSAPWRIDHDHKTLVDIEDRLNYLKDQREIYKNAKDILCIGGGPVGVELVTEIIHRSPEKNITLINSNGIVLPNAPHNIGKLCNDIIMEKKALKVFHGERAYPISGLSCPNANGRYQYKTSRTGVTIESDLVYTAIGIKPNTEYLRVFHSDWLNEKGQVIVNSYLQVEGTTNIYSVGDMNSVDDQKMYFTAHMQGLHCVYNLRRLLTGKEQKPYLGCRDGMLVSLGPTHGIGYLTGILFRGLPFSTKKGSSMVSYLKYIIERVTMNDFHLKKVANTLLYYIHEKGQPIARICEFMERSHS